MEIKHPYLKQLLAQYAPQPKPEPKPEKPSAKKPPNLKPRRRLAGRPGKGLSKSRWGVADHCQKTRRRPPRGRGESNTRQCGGTKLR